MPKYGTKPEVNSDLSQILKRLDQQENRIEGQIAKLQKDFAPASQFEKHQAETKKVEERVTVLEETVKNLNRHKQPSRQRRIANGHRGPSNGEPRPKNVWCIGCGAVGHYFNDCPTARWAAKSAPNLSGTNDQVPTMGNCAQVTHTMNPAGHNSLAGQVGEPVSVYQKTNWKGSPLWARRRPNL